MALKNIMRVDNGNVIYSGGSDGIVSFDLMTKLWENPDPTQPYSTGTIILSSSDYDMLLFQFAHANTNTDLIISAITEKGKNVLANEVVSGSSNPCRIRECDYVSDTSYDVQIAYSGPASASITGQSSNVLIPYQIYGIKTKQTTKMDVLVTDVSTSASKCMMSDGETSVEDVISYSTNEHKVGKWIDGSDLYEKTFSIANPSSGTSNIATLVGEIVNIQGIFRRTDSAVMQSPYYDTGTYRLFYTVNSNNELLMYITGYNISEAIVTVQYIKT